MKQTLLIAMLLLGGFTKAQSILVNETDKETGTRLILTKGFAGSEVTIDDSVVRRGTVFFSAGYQEVKVNETKTPLYFIELNIVHNDLRIGCLKQETSKIVLELEDDSKMECMQISPTECDPVGFTGDFVLMPKGGKIAEMTANLKKLESVAIKKITVFTTETEVVYIIKDKCKPVLEKHFSLLEQTLSK